MAIPVDIPSDEVLMRRIQEGQTNWFETLVSRYRGTLLRAAEERLGSRAMAEDAVQEALLAAFKSRHTFDERASFRTWIWTILLNQCRSTWLKQQKGPAVQSWPLAGVLEQANSGNRECPSSPDAELLAQERRELLGRVLDALPEDQAQAVKLRFFQGLKFQEIASAMNCSLGTAKNRVRWGLAHMANLLRANGEQPTTSTRSQSAGTPSADDSWGENL